MLAAKAGWEHVVAKETKEEALVKVRAAAMVMEATMVMAVVATRSRSKVRTTEQWKWNKQSDWSTFWLPSMKSDNGNSGSTSKRSL